MKATKREYRHVEPLWDEEVAENLDPVELLVYRSNQLGADQRITNTGGGNTSAKVAAKDPLTGEEVTVLWVKGSGGDLRTSKRENFASLYLDRLLALRDGYAAREDRGVKSAAEDEMVARYAHCTYDLNPRATSIDTPLHAWLPAAHVDHMHPNSVIAVAATRQSEKLTREIFGGRIGWLPWIRPGAELALALQEQQQNNPDLVGIVMGQHGIINWAETSRDCYDLSLDLAETAARAIEERDRGEATFGGARYESLPAEKREEILYELAPWLRGQVSRSKKMIGTWDCREDILRFVNSQDAVRLAELGTSCPDHFLRTKIKPLHVDWDPQKGTIRQLKGLLATGIAQYRKDYAAYYEACKRPDSPAMRDSNPTVILIPGIGMIAWGKNKSESRVTAEFYACAVEVMRGAEALDEYIALPAQEAFDIEYWALEEAKLRRQPPEKEMGREVVLVVGAGNGIGKATAHRVAREGAHVVCADLDEAAAQATATELQEAYGQGIGVAGSGISGCGPAIGLAVDVCDRASVRAMLQQVVLAYGGIDRIAMTAGIYVAPDAEGLVSDEAWRKTFEVNVQGGYTVASEARALWEAQDLPGSLVLTTSVNGVISKKGSLAYDTSKAAANHLLRELAIELAPQVRVNGVAPATVVAGSTMFPRERVIASLQKYEIDFDESDDTETLRARLADFYAQRTLTRAAILPEDQAEAIWFLLSERSSKSTGQILSVDGGLAEAFTR